MSLKAGKYAAKVCGANLELLGEKNYPVLMVHFQPITFSNGYEWVEGSYAQTRKPYFLSEELVTSGAFAGRSKIEVLRDELKNVYGYEGGLDPEALSALVGKEVEIVVEITNAGFANVKYVNNPAKPRSKAGKAIPSDVLARLSGAFAGKKVEDKVEADPKAFFLSLKDRA